MTVATKKKTAPKIVAVVQCAIALERCTGFYCAETFHKRLEFFKGYSKEAEIMYVPFSCGGCSGRRVSRLVAHLKRMGKKHHHTEPSEIVVHLSGCMVRDNGHYPKCPHLAQIKAMVVQKGVKVVLGSNESEKAAQRRKAGGYKAYQGLKGAE